MLVLALNNDAIFHLCVILCLRSLEMMAAPKYPFLSVWKPSFQGTCILGVDLYEAKAMRKAA